MGESGPEAGAASLRAGPGPRGFRAELGPGLSGGQGRVQRQLWAQGVLKQPDC